MNEATGVNSPKHNLINNSFSRHWICSEQIRDGNRSPALFTPHKIKVIKKPKVVCHMASSNNGKIISEHWGNGVIKASGVMAEI
jgi:hypothetical protein